MIDFVEWCDFVLKKLLEASRKTSTAREIGVHERFLAQYLFSEDAANQQGFQESTTHRAMMNALSQLQQIGLVEKSHGALQRSLDVNPKYLATWSTQVL